MDLPNVRYCLECGREITDDFGFCTACGAVYRNPVPAASGSANARPESPQQTRIEEENAARIAYQTYMEDFHRRVVENNLKMTVFMLEIWIAMAAFILAGLYSGVQQMEDLVMSAFGLGNHADVEGIIILVSAILAAVSASLCWSRRYYDIAFAACLVSALVTSALLYYGDRMSIYFLLCGLLTSFRIRSVRSAFH